MRDLRHISSFKNLALEFMSYAPLTAKDLRRVKSRMRVLRANFKNKINVRRKSYARSKGICLDGNVAQYKTVTMKGRGPVQLL